MEFPPRTKLYPTDFMEWVSTARFSIIIKDTDVTVSLYDCHGGVFSHYEGAIEQSLKEEITHLFCG